MAEKIQRVPRGLNELLTISGGATPRLLEDSLRTVLDTLQLYGMSQLQTTQGSNVAAAEGAGAGAVLPANVWIVLFGLTAFVVKTATMTALRVSLQLNRSTTAGSIVLEEELGPFGATETGTVGFGYRFPYPLICPPGSTASALISVLGTDATASITCRAEFGVLG